mgnify:CR=1 FL=1
MYNYRIYVADFTVLNGIHLTHAIVLGYQCVLMRIPLEVAEVYSVDGVMLSLQYVQ